MLFHRARRIPRKYIPGSLKFFAKFDTRQLNPLFLPIYWSQSKTPELAFPATEYKEVPITRFNQLGKLMVVMGILFVLGAGFALYKIQEGYDSLQAFSAAQNVVLKYNEQGQLLDRGKPEAAQKIMRLLTEDWGYPVVESELDPNDPLVNTASEYMYQMAVIGYHVSMATTKLFWQKIKSTRVKSIRQDLMRFPWMGVTGLVLIECIRWMGRFARWHGVEWLMAWLLNLESALSPRLLFNWGWL
jgi:hypothetical protein